MKHHESIPIPSEKNFGLVMAAFFSILAIWPLTKGSVALKWYWFAPAFFFLSSGLFFPKILRAPNYLWFRLGILLQMIVSPIVLAIIFFGIFFPLGSMKRLFRGDSLDRKWDKNASTYWKTRAPEQNPGVNLRQQF